MPDDTKHPAETAAQRPTSPADPHFIESYKSLSPAEQRDWLRSAKWREQEVERENDVDLLAAIKEWQHLVREREEAPTAHSVSMAQRQVEALGGKILHMWPNSFEAKVAMLTMAHTILSAKDLDQDHWHHQGIATQLVAIVADSLGHC